MRYVLRKHLFARQCEFFASLRNSGRISIYISKESRI